jgi:hypothetical protein
LFGGNFQHIDHLGRLRASLSAVELAAVSEFLLPTDAHQALAQHRLNCGSMALDEPAFLELVERLGAAEVLESTDSDQSLDLGPVRREGRPTLGRERATEREWQRFQSLNANIRQSILEFDLSEQRFKDVAGKTRVKVVTVQQNGTVTPLALGMIVAFAKAYEGGSLNDHYAFYPDWLVRPSKVRTLTQEPAVFLFSNYNWSHRHNLMVSRKVKQLSPWSITIHGGPNTPKYGADCEAYFQANPDVDITVRGEGELTVAELLNAIRHHVGRGPLDPETLKDIAGISFRNGPTIVSNPDRARIADLDLIPSPMLTGLFDAYRGTPLGIIETNRGCPYSCAFCDWGSATNSRIRKFSIDRVYAELEWCAQHQVAGVMCADANFGIFERDVDIALKIADLKKEYGYPNGFSVSAAKNTTKYTKHIIEILAKAGVMSKGSIGVQSMDKNTLAAIQRSNIKVESYDELALEFRKARLPLWVDLMFGLPGQTVTSFQNDLQGCIDRGVFPRIFRTELLINSPMNEPGYRERNRIVTEPSPDGFKQLVVSTSSFTREDYSEMSDLLQLFVLCDVIGMLRQVSHYVRSETGMREIDFYEKLHRNLQQDPESWPVLAFAVRALPGLLVPPTSWCLVIEEAKRYMVDVLHLEEDESMETVLAVQHALLPARDRLLPETLRLGNDYASWHQAMVRATGSGHHADWHSIVPRLREFGPASFRIDDPDQLCALGIGAAVDGDLFGNFELRSPASRWTGAMTDVHSKLDESEEVKLLGDSPFNIIAKPVAVPHPHAS